MSFDLVTGKEKIKLLLLLIVFLSLCLSLEPCRYIKGPWTDCDPKTTLRTRTLTLKKGDSTQCEPTKTIQKKCKKGWLFVKKNRLLVCASTLIEIFFSVSTTSLSCD